jgi:hypothetical protein
VAVDPATCPHPFKKWETVRFGLVTCKRCGGIVQGEGRSFEWRHSERVTLKQGDRVHVRAAGSQHAFKGTFQWAEPDGDGVVYTVCEKQLYKLEAKGPWFEGTQAVRTVAAERVRQDDGVRARRKREEAAT